MHTLLHRLKNALKLSLLAIVTFTVFATSAVALAESKSSTSCKPTGTWYGTTEWYGPVGKYRAQTTQSNAQCIFISVRFRRWQNAFLQQETYANGNASGQAYTPWVYLDYYPYVNIYVASHAGRRDNQLTTYLFTSHDGAHSTGYWFCNGQSGGNICVPTP